MARPKLGDSETERLHVKITADEIAAIDEWRYANRIPSRSEAVRRLVQIGLFVENNLEDVVDYATEGVKFATDEMTRAFEEARAIDNQDTQDIIYTAAELRDVLAASDRRAINASEAMDGVHHMILTLYNAIAPIAQAKSLEAGTAESNNNIEEANKVAREAEEKRAESEENRYISIIGTAPACAEWNDRYHSLPDEEQEEAITAKIKEMEDEEKADPQAFTEKYGTGPFWETPDWADRLRNRAPRDPPSN